MVINDPRIAQGVGNYARAEMLMSLGEVSVALGRKARAGRVDAIKLLFEASGLHNPRVQHEHSGEVTIKVEMPRPKFVENDEGVTDATVVED
jgi:hypothetical protein